ncbi:MAG: zinc ribbon domain-containing protein [Planctomycetota bacterium]|jgi:predicted  nucleic acid-binding Zn-ribbon protein
MSSKVSMEEAIDLLVKVQEMDRVRDRLQRKLDQVPKKLKSHTDAIAALEVQAEELTTLARTARAEADRAELEVKTKEERRERIKAQMNAPKLSNREYEVLRDEMAGVLADINSLEHGAIKAIQRAEEAETNKAAVETELVEKKEAYEKAKAELEGSLGDVTAELETRTKERSEFCAQIPMEPFQIYERVRRKHPDAMALVEGTIDRAANRIGSDLHCSACYMTITANDAVQVLARSGVVQCKSCVRILYVP